MNLILQLFPSAVKAVVGVVAFLIGIGWGAFVAVNSIVKVEANEIRKEFHELRNNDMGHLNKRMDSMDSKLDILIRREK